MNDRAVQDEIIRYLADATARTQSLQTISAREAAKARQFARFLARRYYRDRLARSFRYSQRFCHHTGRIAEEVVERAAFDAFLDECVLGSLDSARHVGEVARAYLAAAPPPGAWWAELLEYEYAYFLQAATAEPSPRSNYPALGRSAVCRHFSWALPEILPRLRRKESLGNELRHPVTLLFSRTELGRIYVVDLEPQLAKILEAVNGLREAEEIAAVAGVGVEQVRQAFTSFSTIGAVVMLNPTP